ncbi:MAG: hypothetical protein HYY04_16935 [Chloroflexi bacterium]|nr:hypothetical protein [Chloroflexota bacterium]
MGQRFGIAVVAAGMGIAILIALLAAQPVVGRLIAIPLIGDGRPQLRITTAAAMPSELGNHDVVSIASTVRSDRGSFRDLTVDMDVRNAEGVVVLRATQRGVRLSEGDERTLNWYWRVPSYIPPGDYTVAINVYGPNWSPLYAARENAAALAIIHTASSR